MSLTPDAKKLLAETIRGSAQNPDKGLRARLLRAIHDEADRQYRLSVPIANAELDETHRRRRERIEAWIDERARATRPKDKAELSVAKARLLAQAEKEAAATLVNRLVLLRHLEALGLSKPAVLTGGWNSKGYREFREFGPTLCTNGTTDASEGYATLLQLLFDELAVDLPGLFGDVGLTRLFEIPAAMLREAVDRLDDPELASAWTDDTTLGWVYQYWNDPDREALDAKINGGGKIEAHEIASKTQMFTERYMVEWLLQNSLGLTWLCMCRKKGWTADAEQVLGVLEARRVEWRGRREAGGVALDGLMPIHGELEDHWKYYVPQPLPEDAVAKPPESLRSLKILDPACGSGHFLVIAFGLLAALYREEARHRGETIGDREIAESILENNLHGIDIDPRAIQIAAAGLYLKARSFAKDARPRKLNLVAPVLQLGNLPADDPAVVHLREELKREAGIPEELTNRLLTSLAGVDYLGSLLKVDAAVEDAIRDVELEFERVGGQGDLFGGFRAQQVKLSIGEAKATVVDKLERFLARHSKSEDLGLRLDGEQLAAGVRFVRIAREGAYDIVVGNPPYQGLSKTESFGYVTKTYPRGKADLYAAFLERGLELVRVGGVSALITIRGWMFLGQFSELRRDLLKRADLRVGDLGWGAFELMTDNPVTMAVAVKTDTTSVSIAIAPTDPTARVRTDEHRRSLEAGLLAHVGRYEFDPRGFEVIDGEPIVYWWTKEFLGRYADSPKLGTSSPAKAGAVSGNHTRFLRLAWELESSACTNNRPSDPLRLSERGWVRYVKGARGKCWIDPCDEVCNWRRGGLEVKTLAEHLYRAYTRQIRNEALYFKPGIAVAGIGSSFSARVYRWRAIFDNMAASVFPEDVNAVLCSMNSSLSRQTMQSLNPGLHFEISDVNRLPLFLVNGSDDIVRTLDQSFGEHETTRELSVEFKRPGASPWRYAQDWAQRAVDRASEAALPAYEPVSDLPSSEVTISFFIGVALGRFGADGNLVEKADLASLPAGILFLTAEGGESLDHPACAQLRDAWKEHGAIVGEGDDLRTYLRKSFFDYHRKLYENRPIYFPLSSAKKNFVAFVSIHRWQDDTLNILLADHLVPTMRRLEGELDDLRSARAAGNNKGKAEKRFIEVQKLVEELNDFIAKVTEVAEKGPPPPDDKTPGRDADARYVMDLDDGVMVNSAALWPLLEPQWKDPKKWWKELATAKGKKNYDWAHLAARYFPDRVRKACHDDPSLAVAHKCFWELHATKAYAWELRLQDEIRPDFTIDEPASNAARAAFLAEHAEEAADIRANEQKRRARKAAKAEEPDQQDLELADPEDADD
jgi:hypothetical protein